MPSRYRSRQRAMQALFQADLRRQPVEEAIRSFYDSLYTEENIEAVEPDPFMETLAHGVEDHRDEIDQLISRHSEHWRIERMSAVDRNILRLGVYEMKWVGTPPPVVIDQALELARRFSGDEAVPFINGVLDAIRRSLESPPAAEAPATPA